MSETPLLDIGYARNNKICVFYSYSIRHELKTLGFKFDKEKKAWCIDADKINIDIAKKLIELGVEGVSIYIHKPFYWVNLETGERELIDYISTGVGISAASRKVAVDVWCRDGKCVLEYLENEKEYKEKAKKLLEEADEIRKEIEQIRSRTTTEEGFITWAGELLEQYAIDILLAAGYLTRAEVVKEVKQELKGVEDKLAEVMNKHIKKATLISVAKQGDYYVVYADGGLDPAEWDYVYAILYFNKDFKLVKMIIDDREFTYNN